MNKYWPLESEMPVKNSMHYYYNLVEGGILTNSESSSTFQKNRAEFWKNFKKNIVPEILKASYLFYKPAFDIRYSNLIECMEVEALFLTESARQEVYYHPPHMHYGAVPTWLFTTLIYVDDGGRSDRGTTVYAPKSDSNSQASPKEILSAGLMGDVNLDFFDPVKEIDNIPNRIFSFIDGILSVHGVQRKVGANMSNHRRFIRIHTRAPISLVKNLYGLELSEFQEALCSKPLSERAIEMINKDFDQAVSFCSLKYDFASANLDAAPAIIPF